MMNKKDLERLLDQLDEPVFGCDEDGIVVYANRAAATLLGEVEEGQDENPADTWLQGDDGLLFPQVGESVERPVIREEMTSENTRPAAPLSLSILK